MPTPNEWKARDLIQRLDNALYSFHIFCKLFKSSVFKYCTKISNSKYVAIKRRTLIRLSLEETAQVVDDGVFHLISALLKWRK